jgi:hypothetical protein
VGIVAVDIEVRGGAPLWLGSIGPRSDACEPECVWIRQGPISGSVVQFRIPWCQLHGERLAVVRRAPVVEAHAKHVFAFMVIRVGITKLGDPISWATMLPTGQPA